MAQTRAIIDVQINTGEAAASLKSLQTQINSFNSALNRNNRTQLEASRQYSSMLSAMINSGGFFTAELTKMETAASRLDKTLTKGKTSIGQFFSARFRKDSSEAAAVMSLANKRAAALETQFVATSGAANGFREALAIRPMQAFNSTAAVTEQRLAIQRAMLNQATTQMINFGKNTQWAGRQLMVGFTVPLTIFAATAGKTFRELEMASINFKKVYGDAFTTPAEAEQSLNAIRELGKEYTKYGIAVKDTVELAAQAAAAGAQGAALMDATREATRLATLGQMEHQDALDATISLQNAFALSGQELTDTINFLNMVENQTVVTLQDLAGAIPRVAPVIKGLGGDVKDMAAFLAAMQEGGVSSAQAANALKSGLASLINPTNRAQEALAKMGININQIVSANRGDLMGTVKAFAQALQGLDEFSRQQALEKVFGKYQYARLGALFNNIIKDGSQASRVMETAAMSADQLASTAQKELGTIEASPAIKFTAAMEKLKLALAPIGETFTKMATPVVEFFGKLLEMFNALPDGVKSFAAFGTVLVGIIIPAGTMFLGLLMNLIGTLIKFGNVVGTGFKGFLSGGLKGALKAVSDTLHYMSLAEIDAGVASQQLGNSTEFVNQALREQPAAAAGASAAIDELAASYQILIARMRDAALMSDASMGAFATPGAAMQAAGRKPVTLTRITRRNSGGLIYYSDGSKNVVPGTGNTDTVPAMLTPGEFVVNKRATKNNLGLLQAINSGAVQKYNGGGAVARILQRMSVQAAEMSLVSRVATATRAAGQTGLRRVSDLSGRVLSRTAASRIMELPQAVQNLIPIEALGALVLRLPGKELNQRLRSNARGMTRREISDAITQSGLSAEQIFEPFEYQINNFNRQRGLSPGNEVTFDRNKAYQSLMSKLDTVVEGEGLLKDPQFSALVRESIHESIYGTQKDNFMQEVTRGRHIKIAKPEGTSTEQFADILRNELRATGSTIRVENVSQRSGRGGAKHQVFLVFPDGERLDITPGREFSSLADIGQDILDYRVLRERLRASRVEGTQLTHANAGGFIPGSGNSDTVPAMLTPGEFVVNKNATKDNLKLLHSINSGKVRKYAQGGAVNPQGRGGAMRGMGLSMGIGTAGGAMMMAPMIPGIGQNQELSGAMSTIGTLTSLASILPMLPGPAMLAVAGVAALGATAAAVVMGMNKLNGSLAELNDAMLGSTDRVNSMAEAFGRQTAVQQLAQKRAEAASGEISPEATQVAGQFMQTDASKKMIEDLKLVQKMGKDQTEALVNQLKRSILAGAITPEEARSVAVQIGQALGDQKIGLKVSTEISNIFGPNGERLTANRLSLTSDIIPKIDMETIDKESEEVIRRLGRVDWSRGFDLSAAGMSIITLGGTFVTEQQKMNASIEAIVSATEEAAAIEKEARASVNLEYQNGIITIDEYRRKLDELSSMNISGTAFDRGLAAIAQQYTKSSTSVGYNFAITPEELLGKPRGLAAGAGAKLSSGKTIQSLSGSEMISEITNQDIAKMGKNSLSLTLSQTEAAVRGFQIGGNLTDDLADAQSKLNEMKQDGANVTAQELAEQEKIVANLQSQVTRGTEIINLAKEALETEKARQDFAKRSIEGTRKMLEGMNVDTEVIDKLQQIAETLGGGAGTVQSAEIFQGLAMGDFDPAIMDRLIKMSDEGTLGDLFKGLDPETDKAKYLKDMGYQLATFAAYPDLQQKMLDIRIETPGQEGIDTVEGYEDVFLRASSLPDDVKKTFSIDVSTQGGLDRAGKIIDGVDKLQPYLERVQGEERSLVLGLSVNENGEAVDPDTFIKGLGRVRKALKDLESTKPSVRRRGIIEYLSIYKDENGNVVDDPEGRLAALEGRFGAGKVAAVSVTTLKQILQLETEVEGIDERIAALDVIIALNSDKPGMALSKAIQEKNALQTLRKQIVGEQRAAITTDLGGGTRGGAGGAGQKPLLQQLKDQAKLSIGMLNQMNTRDMKRVIAGPFGPEFIEYLRSQGEEGYKLMKKGLDRVRQAYVAFVSDKSAQLAAQSISLPFIQQQEMESMGREISLRNRLSRQGRGQEEIDYIVETTKSYKDQIALNKEIIKQEMKKPKGERDQKLIDILQRSNSVMRKNTKEVMDNADAYVERQKQLEYAQMSTEDLRKAMLDNMRERLDVQKRLDEINILEPLQNELNILNDQNEAKSRAIELKQRELEPIDEAISKLEEEKNKINEAYDQRIQALDEIAKLNERISEEQKQQLDLADALSRGDIAAAAASMLDMQKQQAQNSKEDARAAIEASRQAALAAKDEQINKKKAERAAIEAQIKQLQSEQRTIQDNIYNLQLSINTETGKLESKYKAAWIEAERLKKELQAAEIAAIGLANAGVAKGVAVPEGYYPAGTMSPTAFTSENPWVSGYPMLYGGMVNYKGSREPAPGMMYGGKMKRFANGAFVPGIGITDKVPALLTPGEFVVRKSVAQAYGPLLAAMNGQIYPGANSNVFPRFSANGPTVKGGSTDSPVMYNYNINITAETNASPEDIANAVMKQIKMTQDRGIRSYRS